MADFTLGARASGEGYERLRRALEEVESSNDPGAVQRHTNAVGFYQFMPHWQKFVQKETGRSLQSFLPANDSAEAMEKSAREQREVLFPKYYEKEMAPWIASAKRSGLGKGRSDLDLAIMFHKLGGPAASNFLRTGRDASLGTVDNAPIQDYVRSVSAKARNKSAASDSTAQVSDYHYNQETIKERAAGTAKLASTAKAKAVQVTQTSAAVSQPHVAEIQGNENARILADLQKLATMMNTEANDMAALNRIREEGTGRHG